MAIPLEQLEGQLNLLKGQFAEKQKLVNELVEYDKMLKSGEVMPAPPPGEEAASSDAEAPAPPAGDAPAEAAAEEAKVDDDASLAEEKAAE